MLPIKIKNLFLLISSIMLVPITAACPVPKLGRKTHNGEERKEATAGRKISFLFSFISLNLVIFCFGIFCFLKIPKNKEEAPNKPVNNGNKEFFRVKFKLRLKTAKPSKPDKKKTKKARIFEFCSL